MPSGNDCWRYGSGKFSRRRSTWTRASSTTSRRCSARISRPAARETLDDPNMLILKMEPCDSELMDVQKEVDPEYPKDDPLWSDHKNTSTKRRNSKGKSTKVAYTKIAAQFVKERDGRFECHFDPDSGCRYAQRLLDLNNYVRHCRTKHKERASRLGLVVGVPATDEVPFKEPEVVDTVQTGEERKPSLKYTIIARKLIKKSQKGTFFCAIDERSRCRYSQTKRSLLNFVRHFRRAHAKEATKYDLFRKMVAKKPVHLVLKRRIPRSDGVNLAEILTHHIKRLDGMFWCAIDEQSPCKYVQENYSMSNFLRHFRTVHPMEAMVRNLAGKDGQVQIENRKRYARKIQVSIDQPVVLQACIQLVAEHNLPIECFRWAGFLSLMRPLKTGLELEMDKTSMVQHIHQAVERQISMIRYEMQARLVFVEIESFVHEGNHFLTVSVNYELNLRVLTRVLGLIRATDATPVSELKTKILDLFGRYQLQEEQIIAIVLGNLGSMLGTPKKLQEQFADSLIKPRFVYGDVDRENTLMDALSAELQGQFEVVQNVVCSVFSALNEVVPNADPDFQRIEQFIQDLKSPKYEDSFNEHQISYPTSWCSQRWTYKYKAIRSIVKREQFYVASAQHHPELALAETDWQFLREYHDAFYPLHKLLKTLEQNRDRQHVTFSAFYMQCLMAIKDVRGIDNRFSKPIMAALSQWLMELRERSIFQTMLYLDPRFQYFKSVVLTLEQQNDAQSYILNIWNRINALKPNSEANQIDEDSIKQEDKKDDDMDDFLSEMFGDPAEGSSKSKAIPLNSTVTPVLQQLKSLEIEPRQPHDYDVWNHWLQRSMSHAELFSVAMVVMSLPTNNICLERSYAALVLADRSDGLSEQTLDELLLIRLNRSLFEKAVLTMYDWKKVTRSQE
ncbi:uncharacterized protein LOC110676020 isoform X4 [Aedes aegypti]|uniref:HAT C-terminal dimerisation domain-containing protein n=1 Tax=Aedes aegypti TaxID=7159 RepID=A0A6I8U1F7_AEDAE|nr:uncharacterized protein LOC110676020 isoform X4 [Aedes aegypti]